MKFRARTLTHLAVACILALILSATATAAPAKSAPQKMTAEEVIAKHLESIGSAEARGKIKSHIILGTAVGTFRIGGTGTSKGGAVMASQGNKNLLAIIYGNKEYPYEKAGFDGKDLSVAELRPGIYSTLANFFKHHEMPFKEGLISGTLSASWPLLDTSAGNVKLKYVGTKKIDDRKVYVLEYRAKDDTGLKTMLFFDAETFRHVRTEYEQRLTQQMPNQPGVTQSQNESITKFTEDFSDFKDEGGLTLPHTYKIQLSIESLNRRVLQDWVFTLTTFNFNRQIEDSQFDVRSSTDKS